MEKATTNLSTHTPVSPAVRDGSESVFVGGFESERAKTAFLQRLKGNPGLIYQGSFLAGLEKKALYNESHVFCLPTSYPYEGQPISLLEAYATGCVVVATEHSGIPDVFTDGVNGFAVEKRSPESIRKVLETMLSDKRGLVDIALANRNTAHERYRTDIYQASLMRIVNGTASS